MPKFTPLLILLATLACNASGAAGLQPVLERHAAALGGTDAVDAIRAVTFELTIDEPPHLLTARYTATRDGRMRIDVYDDGTRVFSEGYDGSAGWKLDGGAAEGETMSAAGEAAVKRGIIGNLFGLHERPALGYELDDAGTEVVDGVRYRVIDSTAPDGFRERLFLDAGTGLLARQQEVSSLHPDQDPAEREFITLYGDYRERDGRQFSFHSEKIVADSGERVQTVTVRRLTANPVLPRALFSAAYDVAQPAGN